MMRLKLFAIVVLLVVAGGAIYAAMGGLTATASTGSTLLTADATVATVTDSIAATGTVAATTTYTLAFGSDTGSPAVTWPVTAVKVAVGDTVKAGQVLAAADTSDLEAQIADASRAAKSAALQLSQAKPDRSNATTTATKRQTQASPYNAETADARAKSDRADLVELRSKATLTAPADGTVTAVAISVGTDAPTGAAITMISADLEITTSVVESDVAAIQVGQQATVAVGALNASLN